MVARGLYSASLFVLSPLLGRQAVRGVVGRDNSAVCNFPAGIRFRLRRIINNNDFLGKAVFIKSIPIGFAGTATLSRRLRVRSRSSLRHGCG